jgi:hypothetical protein
MDDLKTYISIRLNRYKASESIPAVFLSLPLFHAAASTTGCTILVIQDHP